MKKNVNKKDLIDSDVKKTINCLEETEDISVSPFFYSKLQAKIGSEKSTNFSWAEKFISNTRLVASTLALLLVLNIFSFTLILSEKEETYTIERSELIETIADDYMLMETSKWYDNYN